MQEEEQLLARRIFDADQGKTGLHIINRNQASSIINPGTANAANWGGNFIVCAGLIVVVPAMASN